MKLYTGTGDDGTTGLFGGGRVPKDDGRVEAYGTVDELNAWLGMVAIRVDEAGAMAERFGEIVQGMQSLLFELGADLATPDGGEHEGKVRRVSAEDVAAMERWIDEVESGNEAMRSFVLPGGSELAARLHVARTVCRRGERRVTGLVRAGDVSEAVLRVLNRVSDLLFAMARRANREAGLPDVPWESGKKKA